MENKNRLLEILKNDEIFATKLSETKSKNISKIEFKEEVVSIIKEHFADYTLEELDKNLEEINNDSSLNKDGELDMDSLNKVAGGSIGTFWLISQLFR
jgi:hypothetical protein